MFACVNHPEGDAAWLCNGCEQYLCDDCVVVKRFNRTDIEVCKGCGDMAIAVAAGITVDEAGESPPLASAFSWPLQGSGPMILAGGTLGLVLIGLLSDLAVWGLMLGYGMAVIQQTSQGNDTAPEWPDVEGLGDIFWPAVLALATAAISFGPAVWLSMEGSGRGVVLAAAAAGAAYAPMAWIAASISKRLLAITPITVVPLILRANSSYWLGCGFLLLALVLGNLGIAFLEESAPWPVGALLGTAAGFYLIMVEMRILGLVWFRNREEFGLS